MGVQSLGQEDPLDKEMATCSIQYSSLEISHGQRSLAGYRLHVAESDTIAWTHTHTLFIWLCHVIVSACGI